MKRINMNFKTLAQTILAPATMFFGLVAGLAITSTNALAQNDDYDRVNPAYRIPTNLPGVTSAADPPEWFNPLTASDTDLAAYGFPPRPDAQANPKGYKSWQKAMAGAKHSIVPELRVMNDIVHGPARLVEVQNSTSTTSWNWSAVSSIHQHARPATTAAPRSTR